MLIGVFAVIDNDFRTRIVDQSITADTTTDTFIWMLENALASHGGKQPGIFIQDVDAAMMGAIRHVFPDATARRCLWHLYQNILKGLHGQVQGGSQQTSMAKLEEKFKTLTEKYPKADQYMGVIYEDRKRWAEYVSPLAFCVGSWATSRVEGQNALIKEKCNACTPLVDVATCFTGLVDNQRDSAMLCDAIQQLPPVRIAIPAPTVFKGVMEASEFSIAPWPRRFMEQEMGAAILYCQLGGEEIAGPERTEALKRTFEYIAE